MSVSVATRSPSRPTPVLGLLSCGFEVGDLPHPEGFAFIHASEPSHRYLSSPPPDWYGVWSVMPWRPDSDTVPPEDIVVLTPRRAPGAHRAAAGSRRGR
ncbi:hypothetical protein [Methylobacterium sp. Leaf118]|uniref:hypothetical protein n=1 Tax=Methylobacterium sp. Leaf118 TaxID=2876562 RepID=UPI001E4FF81F|nr:hypothetical protein [Methylobacterium sp. Leaf118]